MKILVEAKQSSSSDNKILGIPVFIEVADSGKSIYVVVRDDESGKDISMTLPISCVQYGKALKEALSRKKKFLDLTESGVASIQSSYQAYENMDLNVSGLSCYDDDEAYRQQQVSC